MAQSTVKAAWPVRLTTNVAVLVPSSPSATAYARSRRPGTHGERRRSNLPTTLEFSYERVLFDCLRHECLNLEWCRSSRAEAKVVIEAPREVGSLLTRRGLRSA